MTGKRKIFALVCLSSILFQTFIPLTSLALTSGPVSADASSFEPVDTSTMVNPITGDLVYNVPLLEVPGPEGSYPLSLSYHAGINPEQESSWVGLGWTLNPGSVTRSVNGFPDDWSNTQSSRRDYWSGGVTKVTSVGITVPIVNFGSINLGLTQVTDTYKGVGYGWNAGASLGIGGTYSPFNANVGIGSNPFSNGLTLSSGIGVGFDMLGNSSLSLMGSVGENNSIGISASAPHGLLGASLSTGGGFSYGQVGASGSLSNSNDGIIKTETNTTGINLILFNFSKTRTRYWTDETETSKIYGALNTKSFTGALTDNSLVNDAYHVSPGYVSLNEEGDPEKLQEGAFPAFDSYSVTGQGIGGYIRPFLFQGSISKQNVNERETSTTSKLTVQYGNNTKVSNNLGFRFVGDFSNTLQQTFTPFTNDPNLIINGSLPFATPSGNAGSWSAGYNATNQVLVGSKSIQYFRTDANGAIILPNNNVKFIAPVVYGLDRKKHLGQVASGTVNTSITGFSITNENGMTYHYNLPAYNYDEEIYQENTVKNNSSDLRFNRQVKTGGYAYTWHLTAVTGPDYVDRGSIGELDDADYGYWISFEYGKWSDEFVWRSPTEGFTRNVDQKFLTVSMGKKEIYYLNAIKTRTHTALFEKDVRTDGKSASKESFNKNWSSQNNVSTDYSNQGIFNINSNQSLSLRRIYILKNNTIPNIDFSQGGSTGLVPSGRTVTCTECELPNNILDKNDVDIYGRSVLESNSLRIIDLNHDYSLGKGSTTSFNFSNPSNKLGKLTLRSIKVRGKGGVSILPQTEFGYNLAEADQRKGQGTIANGSITGSNAIYDVGDLIETDETNPIFCGYVNEVTKVGTTYNYVLKGNESLSNLGIRNIRRTKNPPYQSDKYDYWGMYKSDYVSYHNHNLSRNPTKISNKSTDVWSLRTVKTAGSLIEINFEGHDFNESEYSENMSVHFMKIEKLSTQNYRMTMVPNGRQCKDLYQVGDNMLGIIYREFYQKNPDNNNNIGTFAIDPIDPNSTKIYDAHGGALVLVKAVTNNTVDVELSESLERSLFNVGYTGISQTKLIDANFRPTPFNKKYLGGNGVRVKSVSLKNLDGVRYSTKYEYVKEGGLNSSGNVNYEPLNYERYVGAAPVTGYDLATFNAVLNIGFSGVAIYGPEIPGPSVMYARVEITSGIEHPDAVVSTAPEKKVLEFFNFKDIKIINRNASPPNSTGTFSTGNLVFQKFISHLGSPKSISYYDGNGKLKRKIVKQYLHDDITGEFFTDYKVRLEKFGYQGLISERFSEVKKVLQGASWITMGTMIAREDYPLVNIGTVEYDYLHNTKTSTRINAFDFYSGAVTESISSDSYGNSFITKSQAAYHNYPAMGSNQLNGTNKNMLTQISSSNVYRLNSQGLAEYLVSASYNVWSNKGQVLNENGDVILQDGTVVGNGNVWRQTSDYVWMPSQVAANGMTNINSFVDFPFANPSTANVAWKRNKITSLMDPYSHELSINDFKGNSLSTRYGYNNSKPVLSSSFAKYGEIVFSGAEDSNLTNNKKMEVKKGTGAVSTVVAHTGNQSIQVAAGQTAFDYTIPVSQLTAGRTYTASMWVNKGSTNNVKLYYQLDGVQKAVSIASNVSTKTSGNWTLIHFDVPVVAGTNVSIFAKNDGTLTTYVDDFRFHPKNSSSVASVYDEKTGELTHTLNQYNLFTRYQYNAMGQVVATYIEQFGRAPYKSSESQLNHSTKSFIGLGN